MALYRKNGGIPQELPKEELGPDGSIYTDLENEPGSREYLNWAEAPPMPEADEGFDVVWDTEGQAWIQVAQPAPPPPPRAELPKSTVMARVFALGKQAEIKALFDSNFELQSKWFTPDWPNVFVDDPALLGALAYIGLTQEEIDTVVAH